MKTKKTLSQIAIARLGLLLGATALILFFLPHPDRQSYNYELNQPWRYPLLTADFDMPIMRDSMSARVLRDSIDANFIPFVKVNPSVEEKAIIRFNNTAESLGSPAQVAELRSLLKEVYAGGVLESKVYDHVQKLTTPGLRTMVKEGEHPVVKILNPKDMLSPARGYNYIDSVYSARHAATGGKIVGEMARALSICLQPNFVIDSVANTKFRNQEYLQVNGAQGVIKKGQRIVDRGEIVTPQVYANLNTYTELRNRMTDGAHTHTYFYAGQFLYILVCFSGLYVYMYLFRWRFFNSLRKMTFLMSFITLFVLFSILMTEYVPGGTFLTPFALVPVVIMVFFDARTAIFSLIIAILLASLTAVFQYQFIFLELMVGLVAAFGIRRLSQRSQLLRVAFFTFVAYVLGYFIMRLVTDGTLQNFSWTIVMYFGVNAVVLSFAYVLILVIEKVFGFTSTVTLVELSDINNPILRQLAEDAPGTFQHSMQVSTLASEAARAIGADTQLVRTGALYHDIGKMLSPVFFTENQHGINPHSGLNPETSAQKIISHVTAGEEFAIKKKLPAVIRQFITEHHGRSVTKYFYNTAVNEKGIENVSRAKFQYPGPNPRSKETTILAMADSVEAASRSLKDYSPQSIDELVERIVNAQVADGLLCESPISFQDVEKVKEVFKKRLATIYHSRVAYPELKKEEAEKEKIGSNASKSSEVTGSELNVK